MKKSVHQSLWRWICGRILALAIGSVIIIALCMWLRYAVQNFWVLHHMPAPVRDEFLALKENPQLNPSRFHDIVDTWWGLSYSTPSIASADWIMVAVLVLVMIPFIVIMGLRYARPLALQFSRLRDAADEVTLGQFGSQAELVKEAPEEMVRFASDFNSMTRQLARYDRELRASHVAMAHELRSPLTAAIGRLQGMLDGVFEPSEAQLGMVMKQLQYLSRLTDELHLLSLADAGQLTLTLQPVSLAELLNERAAWLKPLADSAGLTITVTASTPSMFIGDAFRLGQVFTVLMENALRYGRRDGHLSIVLQQQHNLYRIDFADDGPGVTADFLPLMFERFTRAETSRARHSGGSGLGLSIARAICHAHGGSISASLPEKGGLKVSISLPTDATE
ncbi:sensor histidine kinase [Kosakonia oryzae]|uniref:histidine kinase n=1 Tax=Kosakonia oryzae TaxID=497725 RepID=A0AA94H4K6_9ENTR|nr:ATP-binding protein [Kosakonia oryzae]ANI82552.1 sensor histidine kinase [Kosakonia oryzae]SFC61549.1 Signal transduction histidine kinase [Kosakonia oryzae]